MKSSSSVGSDSGTTLVEVLITFLVTVIFLSVTYESIILGLRYYGRTNDLVQMTNIAEKQLALLQANRALEPGDRTGREDDYVWKLVVSPHSINRDNSGGSRVFNIRLEVNHSSRNVKNVWYTTLVGLDDNGH